ncbi:MAG: hypothetical protein V4491_06775, partial [Pseudomonadota bacterium]
ALAQGAGAGGGEDRRKSNRRVTDRRRVKVPAGQLVAGERRKNSRRLSERRRPATSPTPG